MVSRFSILLQRRGGAFFRFERANCGAGGERTRWRISGIFSATDFWAICSKKLFAALTHAEHRVRKGLSARARLPRVRSCNVRRARAGRGSHRPALGARAALQHHRNDGGIRRSSFSATPCSACASGTTARQKRTSTAVSVCRSRSRGACSVRSPCASCSPRWRPRRWHSVHRDEHRAALPRHRRAVEHRRAAALGRH